MRQWAQCMEIKDLSVAKRRAGLLAKDGLLHRIRLPLLRVSPLVLTKRGCDVIGDGLPPLSQVRLAQFEHDSTLVDLSFDLRQRFGPNCSWIPERRVRQLYPDADHVPDGILRRPGVGDIGIELELTAKSPKRLEAILAGHASNLNYEFVWYFTNDEAVAKLVRRLADGYPRIRLVTINRRNTRG